MRDEPGRATRIVNAGQSIRTTMKPRHAAALALVVWALVVPCDGYGQSAAGWHKVTVIGCPQREDAGWSVTTFDGRMYFLEGDPSKLDQLDTYGPERISGTQSPEGDRIVVASFKKLSRRTAKPSAEVGEPSKWRRYSDPTHRISYSLPSAFPKGKSSDVRLGEPGFVDNKNAVAVANFDIPKDAWEESDFVGGRFLVYIAPAIMAAAECYQIDLPDPDEKPKSVLIHGVRYIHASESEGVPPEGWDYYRTFQHGRCYEIVFDLSFARFMGMDPFDICMLPTMDSDSLIKAVMSEISFTEPR
jgi:hypothetical protein